MVYDLDNEEISLANTQYNATESNILEIGTGAKSVPDATGVVSAVTAVPSGNGDRVNSTPYISGSLTRTGTGVNPTSTAHNASPILTPSFFLSSLTAILCTWFICITL